MSAQEFIIYAFSIAVVASGAWIASESHQKARDQDVIEEVQKRASMEVVDSALWSAKGGWSISDVSAIRILARGRPVLLNIDITAPSQGIAMVGNDKSSGPISLGLCKPLVVPERALVSDIVVGPTWFMKQRPSSLEQVRKVSK